jgi:hypothetical protein
MPNANMLSIKIFIIHKCQFQVIFARISGFFFFTKKDLFGLLCVTESYSNLSCNVVSFHAIPHTYWVNLCLGAMFWTNKSFFVKKKNPLILAKIT